MAKVTTLLIAFLFAYSPVYWDIVVPEYTNIDYKLWQLDSIAYVEYQKEIIEITSNRHPELRKYYASCGLDPNGTYAWCGAFKHYVNTSVGVPGKGAWAAAWISNNNVISSEARMGYGFAIPRTGGSGWHVGQVRKVYQNEKYFTTFEGNVNNRLLSRKIFLSKPGLKLFTYTKML